MNATFEGTIEEQAEQAEKILRSVAPQAFCTAQEWDGRIDCAVRLADGTFAGEMIVLTELSEARLIATGERLRKKLRGIPVRLVNELRPPVRIRSNSSNSA
jgi:hypothetical protein